MKLKNLLLTLSCASVAFGAMAQSHHGYFYKPTQDDLDAWQSSNSKANELVAWFDTDFKMPIINADGSVEMSSIYENSKTDLIPRSSKYSENMAKLHGSVCGVKMENGLLVANVPSKIACPGPDMTDNNAPGTIVFHLCMPGAPARINDAGNGLSYTGDDASLYDIDGMILGIKVPEGAVVKAYLSTPNIKDSKGYDELGDVMRTMAFDFENVPGNKYVEIKSGAPYNSLAGKDDLSGVNAKWAKGYCVKFLDVAVSNLKKGDQVSFGGVQTTHPGWNPVAIAGVDDIVIDNEDAPVEYFNLQGVRVDNPENGLYIRRQGNKVTKVVVK